MTETKRMLVHPKEEMYTEKLELSGFATPLLFEYTESRKSENTDKTLTVYAQRNIVLAQFHYSERSDGTASINTPLGTLEERLLKSGLSSEDVTTAKNFLPYYLVEFADNVFEGKKDDLKIIDRRVDINSKGVIDNYNGA